MDSIDKLSKILSQQRCTLLGIGPMSKNCVDAVADITNSFNIPLMLIASKRQIEAKRFGGGYVNNWTTESFSEYVKDIDKKNNIILCRDHGGPWQNSKGKSKEYGYNKAIEDAKKSYEADICSDFKIIHIDPSEGVSKINDLDIMLERIFDLYDFCFNKTTEMGKKISFEISIGKEDGGIHTFEEVEYAVSRMEEFCMENNFPLPLFLVVRTGNEVIDIPEGHLCCGSAGTYNLLQNNIAKKLLENKISNIKKIKPQIISTGNIGCITQIANGTNIPILHTIELLDWYTGGSKPKILNKL